MMGWGEGGEGEEEEEEGGAVGGDWAVVVVFTFTGEYAIWHLRSIGSRAK